MLPSVSKITPGISSDSDWHAAGLFITPVGPSPNWNGFMQDATIGIHPSWSDIVMLHIIDLKAWDSYFLSKFYFFTK